ncbi:MAG: trimethylamine methyltransferase family protein [Alphaproteobacteria bacterium]
MTEKTTSRRRRGQERPVRATGGITQSPWQQVTYRTPPMEIISADALERIHQAGLSILKETGMKVLSPDARALYAGAGFDVNNDTQMVHFEPSGVEDLVALAPSEFTLHARNPDRNVKVGGSNAIFTGVSGPAYFMDMDRGRCRGTYEEMCNYMKLVQSLNILHQDGGGSFEPLDLPAETRVLDLYYAQCTLLDKNWQPWGLGADMAMDGLRMASISMGMKPVDLIERPVFSCVINTNSPLQLDIPMAEGLTAMATFGQAAIVTPFTLSGAMSPVTLAGALAQQHAEAMATIALTQIIRPGAPVMYGGFTSNVDMKTGSPAFGTPEYAQAAQVSGQLARRLNVPFRSSNVTAANSADAQAAYESMMSLWGAMTGHAHMINHAAGWLGGGLIASFEKLILDAEMLQMMAAYFNPLPVDEMSLALDSINEVGPAGHFFGTSHTLERYESAFYSPLVSNWDNYDNWKERGSVTAEQNANRIWKQLLAEYEQPPIDPGIDDALKDYMARRKAGETAMSLDQALAL